MKHYYINLSISFIIAMMILVISPATIAETKLDMLDSRANNDNLIIADSRRRPHHGRRPHKSRRPNHGRRHVIRRRHNYRRHYYDRLPDYDRWHDYDRRHDDHRRPYLGHSGDHCFIATAVYNSPTAPKVMILREFRDQKLLTTSLGKSFVKFYYKYSPPIANFLSKHKLLSEIVRIAFIEPLVWMVPIYK